MAKTFTIQDFFQKFPDNDACLEHLMLTRYGESLDCPHCGKHSKFSKHGKRPVYQCQWCSHQISPMAGTPFAKSRTALTKWFYAMYLFTTSRHGVPAKELQRQLGVTYKCAWRMGHEIRKYMADVDGDSGLSGHVEVDEAYIGGKDNFIGRPTDNNKSNKVAVMGMVERGGDLIMRIIPKATKDVLIPHIVENIDISATVSTDELHAYKEMTRRGYEHGFVSHKRKHMNKYLGEFEYRYNMRSNPSLMFDRLLASF